MLDPTLERNDPELRRRLSELTNPGDAPDLVVRKINALRGRTNHSVERVADPRLRDPREVTFNCFMYALGLANSTEARIAFAKGHGHPFPDSNFTLLLVSERPAHKLASDGDLIVYSTDGVPAHAGRVRQGRVVSKWGGGPLLIHGVYEIPTEYGEELQFYEPVSPATANALFRSYAQERLPNAEFAELFGS